MTEFLFQLLKQLYSACILKDSVDEKTIIRASILEEIHKDLNIDQDLVLWSTLTDVGNIGVPYDILSKNDFLSEKEYSTMQEHTINGGFLVQSLGDVKVKNMILQHHERIDGLGYPYKLYGNMISEEGKVIGVVDSIAALLSKRKYRERKANSIDKAIEILEYEKPYAYDKKIIELIKTKGEFNYFTVKNKYLEEIFKVI